jgi:hypothetical protein
MTYMQALNSRQETAIVCRRKEPSAKPVGNAKRRVETPFESAQHHNAIIRKTANA